jgi:hypothetical protein
MEVIRKNYQSLQGERVPFPDLVNSGMKASDMIRQDKDIFTLLGDNSEKISPTRLIMATVFTHGSEGWWIRFRLIHPTS